MALRPFRVTAAAKDGPARLGGREAVAERLCSVLTSDYYYPALMAAAFTLVDLALIDTSCRARRR